MYAPLLLFDVYFTKTYYLAGKADTENRKTQIQSLDRVHIWAKKFSLPGGYGFCFTRETFFDNGFLQLGTYLGNTNDLFFIP